MNFWPSTCQQYLVPLKHTCRMNPEVLAESTDPEFEMEYIDIGNVSLEYGIGQLQAFRFHAAPSRARKIVRKGDTLISTVRTYLKAIAYVQEDHTNWIASTGFAILRPDVGIDPRFLYRVTQASPFVEAVVASSTGVSYPAINPSALGSIEIPLPDLETQKAIVDFLDQETARVDQLIEKKLRMVELLGEKRRATVESLVLGGCTERRNNTDRWLSFMPDHWAALSLAQLVKFRGGATPSKDREDYWIGSIPWVSPKDMKLEVLFDSEDHISKEAVQDSAVSEIEAGAVLIVTRGMILARAVPVAILGVTATINQDMKALIPNQRILGPYLLRLLQGLESVLLSFVEEAAHGTKKLRTERLFKTRFPIPPIAEQTHLDSQISAIIKRTETTINLVQNSTEHLRELRAALITAAVTGQIDVATWSKRGKTDRRFDRIEEKMSVRGALA